MWSHFGMTGKKKQGKALCFGQQQFVHVSVVVTTLRALISLSLCVSVQNPAGGSQQGGVGAGDGMDEGASLHTGLPCSALPQ